MCSDSFQGIVPAWRKTGLLTAVVLSAAAVPVRADDTFLGHLGNATIAALPEERVADRICGRAGGMVELFPPGPVAAKLLSKLVANDTQTTRKAQVLNRN